ncbi:MAG: hypothetical protein ABSE07_01115 [Methanoregula sp.]|jgi:hypothetical protein
MFAEDCPEFEIGAGTGDRGNTVVEGEEVPGIFPFDPEGVVVQPKIITNETSIIETQRVLMNKADVDIFTYPVLSVDSFRLV